MTYRTHKKMAKHQLTTASLGLRTASSRGDYPVIVRQLDLDDVNKQDVLLNQEPAPVRGAARLSVKANVRHRQGIRSGKRRK